MNSGVEWMIDASGCPAETLTDGARLRAFCALVITELQLHVIGEPHWHQFPSPGGWTGMYLLSESHLTCHTFPELGLATFNLYCCRPRPIWSWSERLIEYLEATRIEVASWPRGGALALPNATEGAP